MKMNIEEFLAVPMTPSIRLRIGPGVDDAVEIDQFAFDAKKQELIDFCRALYNVDGASWQLLRMHTNGNGTLAKVLIALGELAGVWKMHPRPEYADLWYGNNMLPCIQHGSIVQAVAPGQGVPKPSSGDLEKGVKECTCCDRSMGPRDSKYHDLVSSDVDGWCEECLAYCTPPDPCCIKNMEAGSKQGIQKRAEVEEEVQEQPQEVPDFDVESYLKGFDGE